MTVKLVSTKGNRECKKRLKQSKKIEEKKGPKSMHFVWLVIKLCYQQNKQQLKVCFLWKYGMRCGEKAKEERVIFLFNLKKMIELVSLKCDWNKEYSKCCICLYIMEVSF